MTSAAQAASNAVGAQSSTGPRTEEGKAHSSKNALKHGLSARDLVIREDDSTVKFGQPLGGRSR